MLPTITINLRCHSGIATVGGLSIVSRSFPARPFSMLAAAWVSPPFQPPQRVGPAGHVIAFDLAKKLLNKGSQEAAEQGPTNIEFRRADLGSLLFPDRSDPEAVAETRCMTCCATASESLKTASLAPCFSAADFCSSRCYSPRPALGGGIIVAYGAKPAELLGSPTFTFARAATYEVMNLYAVKMAAVFMISTSTLAIRTGFFARWIAFLGYAFALFLLLSGRYFEWILMLFPMWVLLISIYILIDNLRRPPQAAATSP